MISPTPWTVEGGQQSWSRERGTMETVLDARGTVVAYLATGPDSADNETNRALLKADARLIAAAPGLLAALERAADGLDSAIAVLVCPESANEHGAECLDNHSCAACDDYVDRNGMTRRSLIARAAEARAAIAEARGESPRAAFHGAIGRGEEPKSTKPEGA